MAPIVHGLENRYGRAVDFLYLDVQDPQTAGARTSLGFRGTPHFFLLAADGRVVSEWRGVQDAAVLDSAIRVAAGSGR